MKDEKERNMERGGMNFQFSHHAREEILLRGILLESVEAVLQHPQQIVPGYGDKETYQSKIDFGGKIFLLRVIVAKDVEPPEVITASRTTKIEKYWRKDK